MVEWSGIVSTFRILQEIVLYLTCNCFITILDVFYQTYKLPKTFFLQNPLYQKKIRTKIDCPTIWIVFENQVMLTRLTMKRAMIHISRSCSDIRLSKANYKYGRGIGSWININTLMKEEKSMKNRLSTTLSLVWKYHSNNLVIDNVVIYCQLLNCL